MNPATIGLYHCNEKGWAEYLKKLLLRDQNIQIEILNLEELVPDKFPEVKEVLERSAVTVLLMTPNMCEFLPDNTWLDDMFQKIPEHHTIFSVVAFVEDSEMETIKTSFSSSSKWQTTKLSQRSSNNIKMIADIIDMVEKSEKIKQYQVKEIIPARIHSPGEKVAIIFKTSVSGTVQVCFGDGMSKIDAKKINPATYYFRIPEVLPRSKTVNIYLDSVLISSKWIHFIRYGHEVFESIVFLKQCLGVETNGELDLKLCDIFEKSEPNDGSLATLFSRESLPAHASGSSDQPGLYPTILHLAAAYNLVEFTSLLLESKGALRAFEIRNKDGHNPADIADANQHHDLAKYIREFTDTESAAESCELYVHMSSITDSTTYLRMARNVVQEGILEDIYSDVSTNRFDIITESSIPPKLFPRKGSLPPVPNKAFKQLGSGDLVRPDMLRSTISGTPKRLPSANPCRYKSDPQLHSIVHPDSAQSFLDKPRKFDAGAMGSSSMQELIDLINLVKNREFTEEDAEQSLRSWRERPTSKSYRDRKKALAEITDTICESKSPKQTLLGKLVKEKKSKRKDKEEWHPIISPPIVDDQFTPNISKNRASSTSTSSASTFESRDSCLSSLSREYSDSEDEMQAETSLKQQPVRQRSSGDNRNDRLARRMSRKDMFLKKSLTEEEEPPPPLPPRRKYCAGTNIPITRPPPLIKRPSKK